MRLAEALLERADLNTRIESMRGRLANNARYQEGTEVGEKPTELLKELDKYFVRFEYLVAAINRDNDGTRAKDGKTLSELIAKRDVLARRVCVLKEFYRNVSAVVTRLTHTEVKILPAYDINKLQRDIDACSKELREVDTLLQESNWTAELIESK